MPSIADNIYPPVFLTPWWMVAAAALFVAAVGGYFLVTWLRTWFALRRQARLLEVSKPHKADIIQRTLQEIARIRKEVEAGTLPAPDGAQQVSHVTRSAFDALMNHRTVYAAKYEVAARSLTTMLAMMETAYPTEFSPTPPNATPFSALCDHAVKVVESCN